MYQIIILCLFYIGCSQLPKKVEFRRTISSADQTIKNQLLDQFSAVTSTSIAHLISQLPNRRQCRIALPKSLPAQPLSANEIYKRYKKSVLVVGTRYLCNSCKNWHVGTASGFVINDTGAFVTSYHVVDNRERERMILMSGDGKFYGVEEVLAADKESDFAILQMTGEDFPPGIPLSPDTQIGDKVYVLSHPDNCYYSMTDGIISRYVIPPNRPTKFPYITITADYARGSSGGPVINEFGQVVGVVSHTRSVYYENGENLQMVFKNVTNAKAILQAIKND